VKTARTISCFGKEPCQTYFNEAFRLVEDAVSSEGSIAPGP
jgi:hypothetical protein